MKPPAFLMVDSKARRSVYLDRSRAEEQAVALHGTIVELMPAWMLAEAQERAREARGILPKAGEPMPADVLARLQVLLGAADG